MSCSAIPAPASLKRPSDISILYAARALRGFGDGFAIILLPVYLSALGYGPVETGIVATAALLGSAAIPQLLAAAGMDQTAAIKLMFYAYGSLGILAAILYRLIPVRPATAAPPPAVLGPSRGIVIKLAALFSIDSFAGGFVVQSLLALWLFERFELSLAEASVFFFWSNLLAAFSYPVAAWLSRRVGLINTMVFTHIPSSL